MRILLDECVPRRLKESFRGHFVHTVPEIGFAGKKNGELLLLASGKFDVFITVDKNIQRQHNLASLDIGLILLRARSNDIADIEPLVPKLLDNLSRVVPGKLLVIE